MRLHKCDNCRIRKVKCDEVHPICGSCAKRGRKCTYSDSLAILSGQKASIFKSRQARKLSEDSPLALRFCHVAPLGAGVFQTLALRPGESSPVSHTGKPTIPPSVTANASGLLAAQWTHLAGSTAAQESSFELFGPLARTIPSRLGQNLVFDSAVRYAIDSHEVLVRSGQTKSLAKSASVALTALRRALVTKQGKDIDDHLLLAIAIHSFAECFRGIDTHRFAAHMIAVSEVLKDRFIAGICTASDRWLMSSVLFEEISKSTFSHSPSLYDHPAVMKALDTQATAAADPTDAACCKALQQLVKIPRLASLTRQHIQSPTSEFSRTTILTLAREVYGIDRDIRDHLSRLTSSYCERVTQENDEQPSPPLYFGSIAEYCVVTCYLAGRLAICGIIQRLFQMGIASSADFDLAAVISEDMKHARIVVWCVAYATNSTSSPPWLRLRFLLPSILSFGSWQRFKERAVAEGSTSSAEVDQANLALSLLLQTTAATINTWSNDRTFDIETGKSTLPRIYDALTGGPAVVALGGGPADAPTSSSVSSGLYELSETSTTPTNHTD